MLDAIEEFYKAHFWLATIVSFLGAYFIGQVTNLTQPYWASFLAKLSNRYREGTRKQDELFAEQILEIIFQPQKQIFVELMLNRQLLQTTIALIMFVVFAGISILTPAQLPDGSIAYIGLILKIITLLFACIFFSLAGATWVSAKAKMLKLHMTRVIESYDKKQELGGTGYNISPVILERIFTELESRKELSEAFEKKATVLREV